LIILAVTSASCSAAGHLTQTTTPKVLGQQSGTPTVVGQPAPAGTGELSAVSCADAVHCWAVGVPGPNESATATAAATVIVATANAGATWTAQPVQSVGGSPAPALTGISCPKVTVCMAVGSTGADPGTGVVLTTDDGGSTWTAVTSPTGTVAVTSVQCSSAAKCSVLASDGTSIFTSSTVNFGRTWVQEGTLPAGLGGALDLWCGAGAGAGAAAATCLVAGYTPTTAGHGQGTVALSTDDGSTWTAATVPAGVGLLQAADCLTATRCLAVGTTSNTVSDVVPAKGLVLASADGGHTWTTSTVSASQPIDDIFAIDCPSATGCAMSGTQWSGSPANGTGAVAESINAGVTFAPSTTAYAPLPLTSLACPTARFCAGVGGDTVARITLSAPKKSSGG